MTLIGFTQGLAIGIIAGVGGFGSLIGSAVITLLQNTVSQYTERWQMVLGVLFVATMILAPEGIIGKIGRLLGRRR